MSNRKDEPDTKDNVFMVLASRFLPYWPLFAILFLVALLLAKVYLWSATPFYEASASLIIEDENKGVNDAEMTEAMNPFDSKKIVENEIEVLQSRALMGQVVSDLKLYAKVYEESNFGADISIYNNSPLRIEVKDPQRIPQKTPGGKPKKIFFTFEPTIKKVTIGGKRYAVDEWVRVSSALEIKFEENENVSAKPENDLYYVLTHPKIVTKDLLSRLEVSAANKLSTVVTVAYADPIPERGEDIVNTLLAAYNRKGFTDRNELAENTLSFIEDRMVEVESELEALEKRIQQYRSSQGVVDLSEQGKLYLQDVGQYDRQISDYRRQLAVLRSVESYVISKDNAEGMVPSTADLNNPILASLLEKLYNAELEYDKLKRTTGENNPLLLSVKNEIDKVRPSILENIKSQRNNLSANLANLNQNSEKYNTALKDLPEKERTLLEISREQTIKKELFSFLQKKREETALSYAPSGGDGRIVDMAESSSDPVSPKSIVAYFIALFLSFLIGAIYVLTKELLNSKVLFRSEIENYTDIPIAMELPDVDVDDSELTAIPTKALLLAHFRQLSTSLGLYDRNFTKKKVLITSSIPGEGKSFVSTNLAYSLAQAGKKVALLDMDFLKPYTSKRFQLSGSTGLLDYLGGRVSIDDIINQAAGNKNLSVLPVGNQVDEHTQLLINGRLESLFEELSDTFDYIIMDSAPLDVVSDANLLGNFSDKTLLVVRHGHTPKKVVRHLQDNFGKDLPQNTAIVFNGVEKRGLLDEDYGFGYGYDQIREYGYANDKVVPAPKTVLPKKSVKGNFITEWLSEIRK
ncbi:MAG: polysaccharide biosynthesis tyrosine autokinase [Pricia sp.]